MVDRVMRTKHLGCWVVIVTFAAVLIVIGIANAHDDNHGGVSDPAIRQWYRGLMQPDNPTASCCGEADAYWADEIHVRNGKTYVTITDDRPDAPLGRPALHNNPSIPVCYCASRYSAQEPQVGISWGQGVFRMRQDIDINSIVPLHLICRDHWQHENGTTLKPVDYAGYRALTPQKERRFFLALNPGDLSIDWLDITGHTDKFIVSEKPPPT
jgi:hypothetical protein